MNDRFRSPLCPVRPLQQFIFPLCDDEGYERIGDSHIMADASGVQMAGDGDIMDADTDDVVQPAVPLPEPKNSYSQ